MLNKQPINFKIFTKHKSILYLILKIGVALLCLGFILKRSSNINISEFANLFKQAFLAQPWILIVAILLVVINWGIESVKWKYLINHIEKIKLGKAFMAIMAGLAVSSFTPNRIGEFAGRMLFLKNKLDIRVVALTMVGSMSQLIITLIIGLPGFLIYLASNELFGWASKKWLQAIVLTLPFFYILFFWNIPQIFKWFQKHFKNSKVANKIAEGALFLNMASLRNISFLSFLRYLVFTLQYVLVLYFFKVELIWWQYVLYVPAIYFAQAVIPTFAITELGIRVTVAVAILGIIGNSDQSIMAASSLIWIINIMVPSIIGAAGILFTKFKTEE